MDLIHLLLSFSSKYRETRKTLPLLTVETKENGDSKSTSERGPVLVELQRQNAENLKQIFPEKEYRGLSPNFNIHVSESK